MSNQRFFIRLFIIFSLFGSYHHAHAYFTNVAIAQGSNAEGRVQYITVLGDVHATQWFMESEEQQKQDDAQRTIFIDFLKKLYRQNEHCTLLYEAITPTKSPIEDKKILEEIKNIPKSALEEIPSFKHSLKEENNFHIIHCDARANILGIYALWSMSLKGITSLIFSDFKEGDSEQIALGMYKDMLEPYKKMVLSEECCNPSWTLYDLRDEFDATIQNISEKLKAYAIDHEPLIKEMLARAETARKDIDTLIEHYGQEKLTTVITKTFENWDDLMTFFNTTNTLDTCVCIDIFDLNILIKCIESLKTNTFIIIAAGYEHINKMLEFIKHLNIFSSFNTTYEKRNVVTQELSTETENSHSTQKVSFNMPLTITDFSKGLYKAYDNEKLKLCWQKYKHAGLLSLSATALLAAGYLGYHLLK